MALTDQNFNPLADALRAVEEERERQRRASIENLVPRIGQMMQQEEAPRDPFDAPVQPAPVPVDDPIATLGRNRAQREAPKREPDVFLPTRTDPRALIAGGEGPKRDPDVFLPPRADPVALVPRGAPSSGAVAPSPYDDMERYPFTLAEAEGSDMAFELPEAEAPDMEFSMPEAEGSDMSFSTPEAEGVDMSFGLPEAEGVDMAFTAPPRGSADALPSNPYEQAPDMEFDLPEAESVDMAFAASDPLVELPANPYPTTTDDAPDMAFELPEAEGLPGPYDVPPREFRTRSLPEPTAVARGGDPYPSRGRLGGAADALVVGDVNQTPAPEETQSPEFMARVKAAIDEAAAAEEARTPGRLRRLPEPRPRSRARYDRDRAYNQRQREIARLGRQRSTERERQQREVEGKYMRQMNEQTQGPDSARSAYARAYEEGFSSPQELDNLWNAVLSEQEEVAQGLEAGGTRMPLGSFPDDDAAIVGGNIAPHREEGAPRPTSLPPNPYPDMAFGLAEAENADMAFRMPEAENAGESPDAPPTPDAAPTDDSGPGLAQAEGDPDEESRVMDAISSQVRGEAPGEAPAVPQQVTPTSGPTPEEPQPPSPSDPNYEREMREYEQDLRAWRGAVAAQSILGIGSIVGAAGGAPAEALGGLGQTGERIGETYRQGAAARAQSRAQAAQRRQQQAHRDAQMNLQRQRFDETVRQGKQAEESRIVQREATRRETAEEARGDEPLTPEQIESIASLAVPGQRDAVRQSLQGGTRREGMATRDRLLTRAKDRGRRGASGGGGGLRSPGGGGAGAGHGTGEVLGVSPPVGGVLATRMSPEQADIYNQHMNPDQRVAFEYGYRPPGWFGEDHPGFRGTGVPRDDESQRHARDRARERARNVAALDGGGVSQARTARDHLISRSGFDRVGDVVGRDDRQGLWLMTTPGVTPQQRHGLRARLGQLEDLRAAWAQYQRAQRGINRIAPNVNWWDELMARGLAGGGNRAAAVGVVDRLVPGSGESGDRDALVTELQRMAAARENMIGITRDIETWGALTLGEHALGTMQLPVTSVQTQPRVEQQSANAVRERMRNLSRRANNFLGQHAQRVRNRFEVEGISEARGHGLRARPGTLRGVRQTIADLQRMAAGSGEAAAVARRALSNLRIRQVGGRQ